MEVFMGLDCIWFY